MWWQPSLVLPNFVGCCRTPQSFSSHSEPCDGLGGSLLAWFTVGSSKQPSLGGWSLRYGITSNRHPISKVDEMTCIWQKAWKCTIFWFFEATIRLKIGKAGTAGLWEEMLFGKLGVGGFLPVEMGRVWWHVLMDESWVSLLGMIENMSVLSCRCRVGLMICCCPVLVLELTFNMGLEEIQNCTKTWAWHIYTII